jgi:hypothetical protein
MYPVTSGACLSRTLKHSIPPYRYINEAIDFLNQYQKRLILLKRLKKETYIVGKESMDILKDFEDIDRGG